MASKNTTGPVYDMAVSAALPGAGILGKKMLGAAASKLYNDAAESARILTPAEKPTLRGVAPGIKVVFGPETAFDPVKRKIYTSNASLAGLLHEVGHSKIMPNPTATRVVRVLDAPGRVIAASPKISAIMFLSYFDPLLEAVKPEDRDSIITKLFDFYQRNRGMMVNVAAILTLIHEAAASIIGAYLGKKHFNMSYLQSFKELAPAFATYAAALLPHMVVSHMASKRYAETHPQVKTAAPPSMVVLFADDIADLAIQGYRMRYMLPFNHKSEEAAPVEIAPPKPKLAMLGTLTAGATGAGIGAGLGAFVAGKGNRRLGAALGGIIGSGVGVALKPPIPTYGAQKND
jgi:hypothetical protein